MEHLPSPLSREGLLRLKPKGNDIPIGNIRNGTQPLHLLASRPQHTPFSWTLGWGDQGVDWFYPAWERIQARNPSVTFLTLLSHGTLHQRFICCNRLFWISVVWFSCLPGLLLTAASPLAPWLATLNNLPSSLHLLGSPTWKAGGHRVRCNGGDGFPTIPRNPANVAVGWPSPAKAAVHRKNVFCMPGCTAAAHLYGLKGFEIFLPLLFRYKPAGSERTVWAW